jgi:D-alanine--poly(phosphoribitol) ligase subunit 2
MSSEIVGIIMAKLRELQEQQGVELSQNLDFNTPLFGREGILDSLGLVSLVVGVEQAIEDQLSVSISLADEKAMSQKNSPYRTIGSLAEYASRLVYQDVRDE